MWFCEGISTAPENFRDAPYSVSIFRGCMGKRTSPDTRNRKAA